METQNPTFSLQTQPLFFSSDDEKTKDDYVQKLSTSISETIKDYCKKELQYFKSKVRKMPGKNAQHAEQFITLIDQGKVSAEYEIHIMNHNLWSIIRLNSDKFFDF